MVLSSFSANEVVPLIFSRKPHKMTIEKLSGLRSHQLIYVQLIYVPDHGLISGSIPPPCRGLQIPKGVWPKTPTKVSFCLLAPCTKTFLQFGQHFSKNGMCFFVGKCCRPALHAGPKMVGCAIVQAGVGVVVPPL